MGTKVRRWTPEPYMEGVYSPLRTSILLQLVGPKSDFFPSMFISFSMLMLFGTLSSKVTFYSYMIYLSLLYLHSYTLIFLYICTNDQKNKYVVIITRVGHGFQTKDLRERGLFFQRNLSPDSCPTRFFSYYIRSCRRTR